ncbi:MAG: hypothetical protein J6R08_01085 [Opitutales bacterium]|nr:hypothetical protein [Opitutales bacterium]
MNVNFTVFIDKILSGEKRQTIRKAGKKWENVKVGDKLTLYTGLRTKQCRKLGEAEVESIEDIKIESHKRNEGIWGRVKIKGKFIPAHKILELAEADGFTWIDDFLEFFHDHYGENFTGKIIKWKNFRKA